MIKKKICLIGSYGVGKTSLVKQYVNSIFDEKYHSSIGVKVDKKNMIIEGKDVILVIWDIHGEDEFQKIQGSYLSGTSGFLLVMDGTRQMTKEVAIKLKDFVFENAGCIPYEVLINKSDLIENWVFDQIDIDEISSILKAPILTSAKTGQNVEMVFEKLTLAML